MATCSVPDLIRDACANGFMALEKSDRKLSSGVRLQMLKELAGDESTVGELIAQACENGFVQIAHSGHPNAKGLLVQQLCDLQT